MSTKQIEGYSLTFEGGDALLEDDHGDTLVISRAETDSLDRGYYIESNGAWVDRDHLAAALAHVDSFDEPEPEPEEGILAGLNALPDGASVKLDPPRRLPREIGEKMSIYADVDVSRVYLERHYGDKPGEASFRLAEESMGDDLDFGWYGRAEQVAALGLTAADFQEEEGRQAWGGVQVRVSEGAPPKGIIGDFGDSKVTWPSSVPAPEPEEKSVEDFFELYRLRPTRVVLVTTEFIEAFIKEAPYGTDAMRPSYSVRTGQPAGMEVHIDGEWKLARLGDRIVDDPSSGVRIYITPWELERTHELAA